KLASSLAVRELIHSNKNKIGLVSTTIEKKITPRIERIEGYKETLNNHQLNVYEEWIVATRRSNIINELETMCESGNFPNAFSAVNDVSLIYSLKFLKSKEWQIHREVSLISIDDSPFLQSSTPPTSVVKLPTFDIGRDAAKKILELITDSELEEVYEVERYAPILIKRDSV